MNKFLFKQIDNINLVLFRAVFGLLITIEAFGALATGWVKRNLVDPPFTFNFIGFDFLQYLQGDLMYYYFALMGIFGVFVMLGYKYRVSIIGYAILWTGAYLMQKSSYNNHYYLMMLLCWIMAFLPAHRWFSIDAKIHPEIKSPSMPRWVLLILILQVWIVYTYASVAKFYPSWLDATAPALFMSGKEDYWLIGDFLQLNWVHWAMAYTGIFFDLLIVPLMLWRRTRILGFVVSVFFHLFNSVVFQIGIFPYMSIAFALFFFSPETLGKRFLPNKKIYNAGEVIVPQHKNLIVAVFSIYFLFQLGLPLRHWFFKDDVLWTEEGHRLSWRMMLRSRSGTLNVYVADKENGNRERYDFSEILGHKQNASVRTKPDLMWQLAQKIKEVEAKKGRDVAVYMEAFVSINHGPYFPFTDVNVDLAAEEWHPFRHSDWILHSPMDYNTK
ncbi:HTTM domain-containing protein [Aequorivita sp. H23M31]|uniref:HTTM domain-containing protein n=1 Tax=Aequorivita ciconiae TaxID=2494375 RepID=A0A410G575_9FLAO|nr:HTTM domain-containing protein [Aequorivita sp. H23M31]QAA82438.1 HTTM domain-containing protein [Aequorivita sp. H23M31]